MMDFNLTQEMCLLAIKENAGLEILLNLLDTVEVQCQVSRNNFMLILYYFFLNNNTNLVCFSLLSDQISENPDQN